VVFLCLIVSTLASVGGTYMLRPIINDLVGDGSAAEKISTLLSQCVLLFALYLSGSIATYFQASIMARLAQNAANHLRR
ncbi:MAG: ABC transporter ATP-binding protein, partial [Oscillospiraceae bacterium]|nr:ABC transporter ATP-binding protein [Oscillospiraceae bacterium]